MTHVIITTETVEEMKAILDFARKSRIKFNAVPFQQENSGHDPVEAGFNEQVVKYEIDPWILPGSPVSEEDVKIMLDQAEAGRAVNIDRARQIIKLKLEKKLRK